MVAKKNNKKDILKHTPLFLSFGLCLSLLMTITAFEWRFYDEDKFVDLVDDSEIFDEVLDIPITQQPPPPPPMRKAPPVIEEAPEEEIVEEIEVDLDIEVTETDIIEVFVESEPMEEEVVEEILTVVEEMPSPIGGYPAFYEFVAKNIQYPPMAKKADIQGRVILQITVDKQGHLSDVVVAKGIGFGCDDEAMRVIKEFGDWNPGKQRGKPRIIRMYVPLMFKLTD